MHRPVDESTIFYERVPAAARMNCGKWIYRRKSELTGITFSNLNKSYAAGTFEAGQHGKTKRERANEQ